MIRKTCVAITTPFHIIGLIVSHLLWLCQYTSFLTVFSFSFPDKGFFDCNGLFPSAGEPEGGVFWLIFQLFFFHSLFPPAIAISAWGKRRNRGRYWRGRIRWCDRCRHCTCSRCRSIFKHWRSCWHVSISRQYTGRCQSGLR